MTINYEENKYDITDEEWRGFQSIPEQGYSHRHWVNHKIKQRLIEHRKEYLRDINEEVSVRIADLAADIFWRNEFSAEDGKKASMFLWNKSDSAFRASQGNPHQMTVAEAIEAAGGTTPTVEGWG